MSGYMNPAISDIGTTHEQELALIDARDVIRERGQQIEIRLHVEQKITRDKFGSIKNRGTVLTDERTFYAYPINYNPTDKELDRAGIRERVQVTAKTAMLDWNDAGYTMETLKTIDSIRATVIIAGTKYEIRDKVLESQFRDTYLYVLLGLNLI